ncbi:MAG: SRPBCC family protein [Bacteroidota bacterium]
MKILKYLLFAILAIVVLFFGIGILKPTIKYGHEITVDKPIKEAWAIAKDESKYDQWLKGYKGMELIEGEQDEPGSKYKVTVEPGDGQPEFEMIQTIVEIKDYEKAHLHYDNDFMVVDQIMNYSMSDGQTIISSQATVIPKGIVFKSMFGMMEILFGSFTAQEKENMEKLKILIEENTDVYFSAPTQMDKESTNEEEYTTVRNRF